METKGNYLESHFDSNLPEQQKVINFLKSCFTEEEILSIGRLLNIDKVDYYSKYQTKTQICSELVEIISMRSLFSNLFIVLQTAEYFRERLVETFQDLDIRRPLSVDSYHKETKRVYQERVLPTFDSTDYHSWITICKEKMVLVLGKDNTAQSLERLENISKKLEQLGYFPILIKKQEELENLFNEEKMLVYAALSRFIIIEKTEPAGQIVEAHICAINRFVAVWLQEEGKGDTWMQGDYHLNNRNIKVLQYVDSGLDQKIELGVNWAEKYLEDKKNDLNQLYPWRGASGSTKPLL